MQQEVPGQQTGVTVDFDRYPNAQQLLKRCQDFFAEVENLTPGRDLEVYLNENYGPGNGVYEDLCSLTRKGVEEGWAADVEISGPNYRRSKLAVPSEATRFFSITTVYFNSQEEFSGQHHSHPYGEINCVVQIDPTAELKGMQGWKTAWTSPGPGTHHYPQSRGGAVVALFFLPAGRISYSANPDDPQPASL
ncbi:hypothetical protein P153DRAFT_349540 [Dothidotthia symphoricarpi CBS 119687]|uniref:p-hydroxylaminobenzoate lyase n=1 Tax=Dothidotthia symphoricarpi CBS 119687 TaxID=1392245 RepID=A0A6A6A0W5_9PLEO|nr:uncharacterized protein P153DRAFT_349540 [Dothidotthia symphoricarpi CBS 119687]KAF2125176.1 hypothetical protein P153DRAFT_349540 [Dothidotthia symphoricarpi CBS 119687]